MVLPPVAHRIRFVINVNFGMRQNPSLIEIIVEKRMLEELNLGRDFFLAQRRFNCVFLCRFPAPVSSSSSFAWHRIKVITDGTNFAEGEAVVVTKI